MNSLFAGIMAGLVQVLVGHPFDTIKANTQSIQTVRWSPRYLYQGSKLGLCNAIATNIVVFPLTDLLECDSVWLKGAFAGFCAAPFAFVLDGAKVLRQVSIPGMRIFSRYGLSSTLIRETFGFGLYFGVFDHLSKDLSVPISGALAGLTKWSLMYPVDLVRTRQIVWNYSLLDVFRHWTWKGSLQGLGLCMLRSLLVNACIFEAVDRCNSPNTR